MKTTIPTFMFSLYEMKRIVLFAKNALEAPEGNYDIQVQVYDDEVAFHIYVHAEDSSIIFNKRLSAPLIELLDENGRVVGRIWKEESLRIEG